VDTEKHDFLSSLRPNDVAELNALGQVRVFERGHTLFHENQLSDRVLVVRKGVIKVTATTATGREALLAFCGAGELVGDLAALDGEPRSASVCAVEQVVALALTTEAFRTFVETRPGVAIVLLRMVGRRLREADAKRIEFSSCTTLERVAARLIEFSARFGLEDASGAVRISLPLSQEELAGAASASIQSVGRALQTMRSLKCIETRRREIVILDPQRLAKLRSDA
jgi:CRP/FNR family cyclic AMP-dependent transcriptional regulator